MMKLVFHPSHLPPQPLCFNYTYIDTRGVTWGKDLWICNTSFLFLRFWIPVYKPGLLNLQIVPWTLSKHNNHSSSHKNKKDSRHSCRRADWFSCLGIYLCSLSKSSYSLAVSHSVTARRLCPPWHWSRRHKYLGSHIQKGLWRADFWSSQRKLGRASVEFACPASVPSFSGLTYFRRNTPLCSYSMGFS